jgi:uncharacterized membrane-anchored protein
MPLLPTPVSTALDRYLPPPAAVKVPQITLAFWVIKVLTTGTGEAASDYLASRNQIEAVALGLAGLVAGLALQFRCRRYVAWAYWLAVSMVAVFGTMAADAVHVILDIPYTVTSLGYALAVAAVFALWYLGEGTLNIHSIVTRRREAFYWAAVLATFALGTAVGDLSAVTLGLGYLPSAVLYGLLMMVPAVAWARFGLNPVIAFWAAYVLTRPLGASIADWLGKPADRSGLGWGDLPVTLVATVLIVALVGWQTLAAHRSARPPAGTEEPDPQPEDLPTGRTGR